MGGTHAGGFNSCFGDGVGPLYYLGRGPDHFQSMGKPSRRETGRITRSMTSSLRQNGDCSQAEVASPARLRLPPAR